jgi:hypothetical protein
VVQIKNVPESRIVEVWNRYARDEKVTGRGAAHEMGPGRKRDSMSGSQSSQSDIAASITISSRRRVGL